MRNLWYRHRLKVALIIGAGWVGYAVGLMVHARLAHSRTEVHT